MPDWDGLDWMLAAVVALTVAALVFTLYAIYQDYQFSKWVEANCEPTDDTRKRRYTTYAMVGKVMVPMYHTRYERRWIGPDGTSYWISQ